MSKKIQRHDGKLLCVVDGIAASAAFDLLQTCPVRLVTPRAQLMQHTTKFNEISGNAIVLRNRVRELEVTDESRARANAARIGMPLDEYNKKIAGGREWHLSAREAVSQHVADDEIPDILTAARIVVRMQFDAAADGGTP
jgi:ATP-dependent protease ClpP protease subunit